MPPLDHYRDVWLVDFEFRQPDGERPTPVCMVAREWRSGRLLRLWADQLHDWREAPFPTDSDSLFVAYYASAELSCFLALGWPMPARILDLFAEFRCLTNGLETQCGAGLIGALTCFGLDALDAIEKERWRELVISGEPLTAAEREGVLTYCQSDADSLARLLPAMLPTIDLPRALLRGRYMAAVARMEWAGVPIDRPMFARLGEHWDGIKARLVERVDLHYGVYEGIIFKACRFADWLVRSGVPWPVLASGRLDLKDDTFREMARAFPTVSALRELRHTLGELKLFDLAVGTDGRNRCLLSAFRAKTGRNQPSNTRFIFGPSVWLRGLIRPDEGRAVAYVDFAQQEFGIAAALSGDPEMQVAYSSGDPYLAFAKQAGAVPADATKESHGNVRDQFKTCALGVQYGLGALSLSQKIGQSEAHARRLLELHRRTFPQFWQWSDAAIARGMLKNSLSTVFGWTLRVGPNVTDRSLGNFPMQANGAEMLRLACCLATEAGLTVCAPIHDALLVEGPTGDIEGIVAQTRQLMGEASKVVLNGFEIGTDAKTFCHPDRYMDGRGAEMWQTVQTILEELEAGPERRSPIWDTSTAVDARKPVPSVGPDLSQSWDTRSVSSLGLSNMR